MSGPNKKPRSAGDRAEVLERLAIGAALLVVVGLLVESGKELRDAVVKLVLPSREVQGNVLVTLGVAAETFLGWRALKWARKAELDAEERIATAQQAAADASDRAAKAEKDAAEFNLARVRIEEQLFKPHILTEDSKAELIELLNRFSGPKRSDVFVYDHHVDEVFQLADSINGIFKSVGWDSKLWIGAEPRIMGTEVVFCVARDLPKDPEEHETLQRFAGRLSAIIFKLGIGTSVSIGGFSADIYGGSLPTKPLAGWSQWNHGDVALLRVQVGHRQLSSQFLTRPVTPPQA